MKTHEVAGTAKVEVIVDTNPIEQAMLVMSKHLEACAAELAELRSEAGR